MHYKMPVIGVPLGEWGKEGGLIRVYFPESPFNSPFGNQIENNGIINIQRGTSKVFHVIKRF